MLLNRIALFLELLFSTESICFQSFLREHTLQGDSVKKQQQLLLCDSEPFHHMQKVLAIVGRSWDLPVFWSLTVWELLCFHCWASSFTGQKLLWKIPVPQHWTYFWENFNQDCLVLFFLAAWRRDRCSEKPGNVNCANQLSFTGNLLFQSEKLLLSMRISAFSCMLTWLRLHCSLNGISWVALLQVDVIISSWWLWLWKPLKGTGACSCAVQGPNRSCNFIRYVDGKAGT